jgi:hypothetical protein
MLVWRSSSESSPECSDSHRQSCSRSRLAMVAFSTIWSSRSCKLRRRDNASIQEPTGGSPISRGDAEGSAETRSMNTESLSSGCLCWHASIKRSPASPWVQSARSSLLDQSCWRPGGANAVQYYRSRPGRRRLDLDRCPVWLRASRLFVRLRQLRALHVVCRVRASDRARWRRE